LGAPSNLARACLAATACFPHSSTAPLANAPHFWLNVPFPNALRRAEMRRENSGKAMVWR
jgi:hypothetical protein